MREYAIRGSETQKVTILNEKKDGYKVRITRYRDNDWKIEKEEFMSKELLDTCLRTQYLVEVSA
ncbi:MAG: hypothetical protein PF447_14120 [Spirochaetaceae bacterium]|jgi:hypothetical protein|nr:hypothetical protein [Spirochaetaceae bacterium]